ncbi:glucan endo-1,3-beta-D-glucosidase-like isoform X2 [Momordica charantia]|uniref:glucan endo-1,3-beta-D-glucosidase n=1 Tax=Momordica charantia TaxID=3673 RepID=A0A6J1DWY3_MOMCH|nr:glucan endo-1,3-beta-D-glucosidase-like isoform X2 [Momordica charantia]
MGTYSFLYILLSAIFVVDVAGWSYIGVNYGRVADNLASPSEVVKLLKYQGIYRVKIFDTDATVLTALANTGIYVIVCLPNELLSSAADSQSFTDNWVQANITKFYPATKIEFIAVGNEVFTDPTYLMPFLVPAMKNIQASLQKFKAGDIKVSSPIPYTALTSSFPPSSGAFNPDFVEPVIKPMLEFLRKTQSALMVNIYPFFAYMDNSNQINLDYAVFRHNPSVEDTGNGNKYSSLFVAQVDAVYAAMSKLQYDDITVLVSETGWPSDGDDQEVGSNVENAAAYNGNLVRRVLIGAGTPLRPAVPLHVILFALFNENKKPGPTSERNYGLFYPNGQRVYEIALNEDQLKNGPKPALNISTDPVPPPAPPVDGETPPASGPPSWCVAIAGVKADKLKSGLEYACGVGGADCGPIQPGSTCFNPNTIEAHASYAFNSYYQKKGRVAGSCDFDGAAVVVNQPPKYGDCDFPPVTDSGTPSSSGTPPTGGTPPTSGTPSSQGDAWCVAKSNAGADELQKGLEYACGAGADCNPIQPGGVCYNPNTIEAHASYAFNSYYQKNDRATVACDFGGAASIVTEIPVYGDCKFPTSDD